MKNKIKDIGYSIALISVVGIAIVSTGGYLVYKKFCEFTEKKNENV